MARGFRAVLALALVVSVAAVSGVGRAEAGLFGCNYPTLSKPFAQWNDWTWYFLNPGGNFEGRSWASTWKLAGGAAVVPGNEPFFVNDAADVSSLTLPAGATATGPASCIFGTDLKVRLFARSSDGSPLKVDVLVPAALGLVKVVTTFTVATGTEWQPTATIVNLANVLSLTTLSSANISLRFTALNGSTAQIDDVYIDPVWQR